MERYIILGLLPVLGGLIGWSTNYLAIKMLFHPRKKISIFGIKIHGLFPRRQEEIAVQISETIEEEFFSSENIVKAMESMDLEKDIEEFIEKIIDERFSELIEGIPLMGSFVTSGILAKVKKVFKAEIMSYKDKLISDVSERVGHALDVKQIVYERISDYNVERLEEIVKKIAKKELRHIELLGGLLGFAIGLIQIAVFYFAGMV